MAKAGILSTNAPLPRLAFSVKIVNFATSSLGRCRKMLQFTNTEAIKMECLMAKNSSVKQTSVAVQLLRDFPGWSSGTYAADLWLAKVKDFLKGVDEGSVSEQFKEDTLPQTPILKTAWAIKFQQEADQETFAQALRFVEAKSPVVIAYQDAGDQIKGWAIIVKDTEFWLDLCPSEESATALCDEMGWFVSSKPRT